MEPFKLNMSTEEYFDRRIIALVSVVSVFVILSFSLYNYRAYYRNAESIGGYKNKITLLNKRVARKKASVKIKKISGSRAAKVKQETDMVNLLIIKDIFPWVRLLDTLELRAPESFILKSLTTSKKTMEVSLRGTAESARDISIFLSKLEESKIFKNRTLSALSIDTEKGGPANGTIEFQIEGRLVSKKLFPKELYIEYGEIIDKVTSKM